MPRGQKFTFQQWLEHKESIRNMWIEEGRSFAEVAAELAKVGFYPTKRQFDFQISKWGFSKYTKSSEKEALIPQPEIRCGSSLVEAVFGDQDYIVCNNKPLSKKNFLRWRKHRTKHSTHNFGSHSFDSWSLTVQETESTPDRRLTSPILLEVNFGSGNLPASPRQTATAIWSQHDVLFHNDETYQLAYGAQLRCDYGTADLLYRLTAQRLHGYLHSSDERFFTLYRNIAVCLINQGDYQPALQISQLLSDMAHHNLKVDDLRRLSILHTMAAIHEATGTPTVAEDYRREIIQIAMQKFGLAHNFTVTAMAGLASVLRIQNKLTDSEQLYSKVLQLRLQMPGGDFETCQELRQLADVLSDAGRIAESLQLYRTAEERATASLGESHHITLRIRSNLAADLRIAGYLDVSAELLQSTIARQTALLGEHHPDVSWTSYQYAKCLMAMDCYGEALAIFQNVLLYRRQRMGETHIRTLNCCVWTGWCSERVEQLTLAFAYYQHVLNSLPRGATPWRYSDAYRVRWLKKAVSRISLLTDPALRADGHVLEMTLHDAAQKLEIANEDGSPVQCIIEEESDCAETCAVAT